MFDDSKYTVEQKFIKDFVKQLSKSCDYLYFLENMKREEFPTKFWKIIGEGGYIGILTPEAYGGTNFKAEDSAVFMYNMAKNTLASYQLINQIVSCEILTQFASEPQKKEYLSGIIDGNLCSLSTTELNEGMSLFDMNVTASKNGSTYTLSGTKSYAICAKEASHLIIAARTSGNEGDKDGISLFIVDPKAKGIDIIPKEINVRVTSETELMTITGDTFYEISLDNVTVAQENMIGPENMAGQCIQEASDLFMIMLATATIGWGDYVLDKAVEYAKNRTIYEEPIGAYQAVQHPLVRAKTNIELAKLAVSRAVNAYQNKEDKDEISVYASIAKYTATEASYTAFDVSMQTHGGYSFDRETGIITLWPMVLLSRIIPINNDIILEAFSEASLGLPEAV